MECFDRRLHASGSHWLRLSVEDFCQATGTSPEQKYVNQAGPGMVAIAALLAQSAQAAEDLRCFFQADALVSELVARTPGEISAVQAELPPGFRNRWLR